MIDFERFWRKCESLQSTVRRASDKNSTDASTLYRNIHNTVSKMQAGPDGVRLVFPIERADGMSLNRFGFQGIPDVDAENGYMSFRELCGDEEFDLPLVAQFLEDEAMAVVCQYVPRIARLRYERKLLAALNKRLDAVLRELSRVKYEYRELPDPTEVEQRYMRRLRSHDREVFRARGY